jgi:hypothetical protein
VFPGLAHRTVRCTRSRTLQTPQLQVSRRSSAIIHRTVRCTSGATAIYAQRSTLTDEQCITVTRQKSEQKVRVAPDCQVWHRTVWCRMRTKPPTVDQLQALMTGWRGGAPDTVRWRTSPTAFSNGYNLVGGYNYHPNRPLQGVGAQATFQVLYLTYPSPPNHLYSLIHPIQKI